MSFPGTLVIGWEEIVATGTTKKCPLGTRAMTEDGRIYRYSKASATAIPAGAVVTSETPTAWGMAQSSDGCMVPAGSTISSTAQTFGLSCTNRANTTALAADYFADGWITIGGTGRVSTAHGQMLKIKSHTAASAASTELNTIYITLKDGQHFVNTINTSYGFFGVIRNPYAEVAEVVQAAQPINEVLGCPNVYIPASNYFWLQTWGPCVVEWGIASTITGAGVGYTTDVASTGASCMSSGISVLQSYLGILLHGNTSVGYAIVDLRCSP